MVSFRLRSSVAACATLLAFTNLSIAQPLDGVWSNQTGCHWLEQNAKNATTTADNDTVTYSIGYLDNTGINGVNWGCAFNSMELDANGKILADSNCWMETDYWEQDITITKNADSWIVVMHEDVDEKIYLVFDTQCIAPAVE